MKNNYLYYLLFSLLFGLSCTHSKSKDTNTNKVYDDSIKLQQMKILHPDSIINIGLSSAIQKYGEPDSRIIFNSKDEPLSEFRIELQNHFSESQLVSGIIFEELTWALDNNNNLTVWYEANKQNPIPIHYLIWNSGQEF